MEPERTGRKGQTFRAAGGKKVFWGAACFVPAQTPARGEGFLPLRLVWASGLWLETPGERNEAAASADARGGKTGHISGDTQPAGVTLPGRCKNGAAGSARSRLPLKDILKCRQNTLPGRKNGAGAGGV